MIQIYFAMWICEYWILGSLAIYWLRMHSVRIKLLSTYAIWACASFFALIRTPCGTSIFTQKIRKTDNNKSLFDFSLSSAHRNHRTRLEKKCSEKLMSTCLNAEPIAWIRICNECDIDWSGETLVDPRRRKSSLSFCLKNTLFSYD